MNRPDRLNAINNEMTAELAAAVGLAERDDAVHVLVVTGKGRAFCAGYDLKKYAESPDAPYSQSMPWDPMVDYGYAVAGGSDIALSCDLVVMTEDARIG